MSDTCPSELALDDAELHGGEAAARVAAHVAGCARCQARGAERRRLSQRFEEAYARPAWAQVATAAQSRRRWAGLRGWRWLALASPLAVAAAFVIARVADLHPPARESAYRGTKGTLAVEMSARRAGLVFAVEQGTPVRPGDELQLTVRSAASARYVLVGSVDGTGRFSPFYPATDAGESVALPPHGQPLAPPIVLDAAPGPERILVLTSARPLTVQAVRPLAEAAAASTAPIQSAQGVPVASAWSVVVKESPR